jgi:hypothetical protein
VKKKSSFLKYSFGYLLEFRIESGELNFFRNLALKNSKKVNFRHCEKHFAKKEKKRKEKKPCPTGGVKMVAGRRSEWVRSGASNKKWMKRCNMDG